MTAAMTPDMLALCAAIDAGDDSALLPLADALDDAADPRAAGLRVAARLRRKPWRHPEYRHYEWGRAGTGAAALPRSLFDRTRPPAQAAGYSAASIHTSRSAAYLALAEALTTM